MKSIHDYGYKKLFSNRTIFRQLIETFVEEDWVCELDFGSCEAVDKSFVSDHYKATESDIIYRLRLRDKPVYIYILLEFQSTVDRFMALRILNYITNFYMDYCLANRKVERLPAIFPLVLYNGDRRWTAPTNIRDLIDPTPDLNRYRLSFEYLKLAENEYSRESLLQIRNIVSTLFLAESQYDITSLEMELLSLFDRESDKQAVSLFLNWFKQLSVHGRIGSGDYDQLERVYESREEVKSMLVKAIEKEKKAIFRKGFKEGKREGELKGQLKGKLESKLEIARSMLKNGLSIESITDITGLSKAEVTRLQGELP